MSNFTPYKQEELPYDFSALEPVISGEIMDLHYNKHHKTYVTNLNTALEKYLQAAEKQHLDQMIPLQSLINFNGGGHLNHTIFWTNLAPEKKGGGGEPSGELAKAIEEKYGSFKQFVDTFHTKTVAIQGSGWGWLGVCKESKTLCIHTTINQDPLVSQGIIPLLGVDVWEHAYYLQYKNMRADYLKNIWKIVNWKNIEERFKKAV